MYICTCKCQKMGDKEFWNSKKQAAIYEAYKSAWKEYFALQHKGCAPEGDAHKWCLQRACHTPQPHFWISARSIYRILRKTLKGYQACSRTTRTGLSEELLQAYHRLKARKEFRRAPLIELAYHVAAQPCSGFFMSPSRIYRAVLAAKKAKKEEK